MVSGIEAHNAILGDICSQQRPGDKVYSMLCTAFLSVFDVVVTSTEGNLLKFFVLDIFQAVLVSLVCPVWEWRSSNFLWF